MQDARDYAIPLTVFDTANLIHFKGPELVRLGFMSELRRREYQHIAYLEDERRSRSKGILADTETIVQSFTNGRSSDFFAVADGYVCLVEEFVETIKVTIAGSDRDLVGRVLDDLQKRAAALGPDDDRCTLYSWSGTYRTRGAVTAQPWEAIRRNYPSEVASQLDTLVACAGTPREARLLIWHGPPGTGKTSAIRAIATAWSAWCETHLVLDPASFLKYDHNVSSFLADRTSDTQRRSRLLVLEDVDGILDDQASDVASRRMLLNLCDGVLDDLDLTVLVTTNVAVTRFNPALTRPGRCLSRIHFRAFTAVEAQAWLAGGVRLPKQDYPLAELYALQGVVPSAGDGGVGGPATGLYL